MLAGEIETDVNQLSAFSLNLFDVGQADLVQSAQQDLRLLALAKRTGGRKNVPRNVPPTFV
jgi:hypothetical protein